MVTFKRFIGTGSLVAALLTFSLSAGACVSEAPRHNNYLFSVFNRSLMDDRFMLTTDKYWQQYLGDNNAHYQLDYYRDLVLKKAVKQKDTELATYCRRLNAYLGSDVNFNAWDYPTKQLRQDIITHVIFPALPSNMIDGDTQFFINPTGRFVEGGPAADSGLTGRKLMVDTYGGYARHGGGAFSGKDASKVDRSGAYMARYLAKNIVANELADRCEVQLSYAIGLAEPLSLRVDTFGSGNVSEDEICKMIISNIDLRPAAIIQRFNLTAPVFSRVSCYGHFGSNASQMPWEQTDIHFQ